MVRVIDFSSIGENLESLPSRMHIKGNIEWGASLHVIGGEEAPNPFASSLTSFSRIFYLFVFRHSEVGQGDVTVGSSHRLSDPLDSPSESSEARSHSNLSVLGNIRVVGYVRVLDNIQLLR